MVKGFLQGPIQAVVNSLKSQLLTSKLFLKLLWIWLYIFFLIQWMEIDEYGNLVLPNLHPAQQLFSRTLLYPMWDECLIKPS